MAAGVGLAGAVLLAVVLTAIVPGDVASLAGAPGPNAVDRHALNAFGQPSGPSAAHLLGADRAGRDVLSRLVYAARIALEVGFASAALAMLIGAVVALLVGLLASRLTSRRPSRAGHLSDRAIAQLADAWLAIPLLLFGTALAVACSHGHGCAAGAVGPGVPALIGAISLTLWPFAARRRSADLLRTAALLVPAAILYEAALSFLGVGPGPRTPTWGGMIAEATPGSPSAWWSGLFPGLALLLTVLATAVLASAIPGRETDRPAQAERPRPEARPHPFLRFALERVLRSIAVLVLASLLVYVIFRVLPSVHGIGEPLDVYLRRLYLHFDVGHDAGAGQGITGLVLSRAPVSAFLLAGGIIFWIGAALLAGTLSALRPRTAAERVLTAGTGVLAAAPVFWLGLVALYLFALDGGRIHLLPGQAAYGQATTIAGRAQALVLPWIVMALGGAGLYLRQVRRRWQSAMTEDYILTARLKGLPEPVIVFRHALRSTASALSAQTGRSLGSAMIAAAILVEPVFGIPGVGGLLEASIRRGDLRVIRGVVLFGLLVLVVVRLAGDLLHACLDPRVRR